LLSMQAGTLPKRQLPRKSCSSSGSSICYVHVTRRVQLMDIVIVAAKRTPMGAFQGALANLTAPELGACAIASAMAQAGLKGEQIDEAYMGNVLSAGVGQAPARQAVLKAGLP